MDKPFKFIDKLIANPQEVHNMTLEIIDSLFLNQSLATYNDCIDLAINLFQVPLPTFFISYL